MVQRRLASILLVLAVLLPPVVSAQGMQDPAKLIALQRDAMTPLDYMNGVWRGPAWSLLPSGEKHDVTQTERIGPFLDGSVKVIEGRGYGKEGKVTFNAFGTISFDPNTKTYTFHSYAMGHVGDFVFSPVLGGYTWEIPMGPTKIRYTAMIKDGKWNEVGDLIDPGKDPVRIFEMNLVRVGDTDWPASGAIPPQ
jgi:hypothetical protein